MKDPERSMKVMKFGGSSVATPQRLKNVARIILDASRRDRVVVIVSAFQGVTNQLLECARRAEKGDQSFVTLFNQIAKRHRDAMKTLHGSKKGLKPRLLIEQHLNELRDALQGVYLLRHSPPRALDLVASFGERLSAIVLTSVLSTEKSSVYVDSRKVVVTDDRFMNANVDFTLTNRKTKAYFEKLYATKSRKTIAVVTGFIGATEDGRTTTIGRNGSDYSAAIIGGALDADVIEIWTDVDGVLTADPRDVPAAFVLSRLSYEEAMEMSYFGANVLHSAAISPAVAKAIPILIKNTLNPSAPGTWISKGIDTWVGAAKGITSVDDIALLTLRGMSMVGVPGTAQRLFGALASAQVNVILISQASSEHTICFAVRTDDAARARKAIAHEFRYELQSKLTVLDEKPSQTIIAVVGEGMRGTPGVSGKVFQTLGRSGINVSAIAQGASERNISCVIDSCNKVQALNLVHNAFFKDCTELALVVVGVGNVGAELLNQVQAQSKYLARNGFDLRVVAISDSKRSIVQKQGFELSAWRAQLTASKHHIPLPMLARQIAEMKLPNVALVDCTASARVVDAYTDFINANAHIITPNKLANVLPWRQYDALMQLLRKKGREFYFEANVGAGLPVISTLKDLIATGDSVYKIEGTLSGTLSFVFNHYDGTKQFSAMLREAFELGYTEPDPREDLSGKDVARKLLILARQNGLTMNMRDVRIESLVPTPLRNGVFSTKFFSHLAEVDEKILRRFERAQANNQVLRYVGTLDGTVAKGGLKEFPNTHPFAHTHGSESVIVFSTKRYSQYPLVIKGMGAGAEVTAMGAFSDILKLLHSLA
jgi:aspartokinase/homoserine dehydrogenase 1